MYTSIRYTNWYSVKLDLRASSRLFKEIHTWCTANFGNINRYKSNYIWDWGSNYGYSLWFSFKNKEDKVQFILTWGEHVKIL